MSALAWAVGIGTGLFALTRLMPAVPAPSSGGEAPPGGWPIVGDETMVSYRGFQIFVGNVAQNIGAPYRWRVADSVGEPVENGVGFSTGFDQAIADARSWIDTVFPMESAAAPTGPRPMPPRPPKPKPTTPPKPKGPKVTKLQCEVSKSDGPFQICLYQPKVGSWAYRVLAGAGDQLAVRAGFGSKTDALAAAWEWTAAEYPNAKIADEPFVRHGMKLFLDGIIEPANKDLGFSPNSLVFFSPAIQKALANKAPAAVIVLDALQSVWPAINPFRLKWHGQPLLGPGGLIGKVQTLANIGGIDYGDVVGTTQQILDEFV